MIQAMAPGTLTERTLLIPAIDMPASGQSDHNLCPGHYLPRDTGPCISHHAPRTPPNLARTRETCNDTNASAARTPTEAAGARAFFLWGRKRIERTTFSYNKRKEPSYYRVRTTFTTGCHQLGTFKGRNRFKRSAQKP